MTWRTIGSLPQSPFTPLDFRSKLASLFVITLLALLWESPVLSGVLALLTIILCLIAGIRFKYLIDALRVMWPFFAFLLVTQGFWNTSVGRTTVWTAPQRWWLVGGKLRLTTEGVTYGFMLIFRTLTLILITPLVIFTTDLNALIVGLVRMRVPYKVAFVFSATLRFVPLLFQEINGIIEVQRLRGLAVEKMGLMKRLQVYSRIAVPLILGAMAKSQQIEIALAAKAFSGSPDRTYLHETALHVADYVVLALCLSMLMAALVLRVTTGWGSFSLPKW